ncbi:hypothetical protein [Amphritea balenae]|nr:hypothetical protein [Amphritea balenae]
MHYALSSSADSLDDDSQACEKNHIWVSQKAPWYQIRNDLPEF